MGALNFIAGPHTASAGDAGRVVEDKERIRVIPHGSASTVSPSGISYSIDAACECQFAQWPRCPTPLRLFRQIQFDDIAAMPPETVALGSDDHVRSDRSRAGGGSSGLPVNFADTESAGAKWSELMRDTEAGYRNPGLPRSHIDGIARFGGDSLAVYIELHRSIPASIKSSCHKVIKSQEISHPGDLMTFRLLDFLTPLEFIRKMFNRRQHRIGGTPT